MTHFPRQGFSILLGSLEGGGVLPKYGSLLSLGFLRNFGSQVYQGMLGLTDSLEETGLLSRYGSLLTRWDSLWIWLAKNAWIPLRVWLANAGWET